jgi:hypothetical protein
MLLEIDPEARCLDHGGGHGVFVRLMRDLGLDFRWSDKYAENLYARGFEGALDEHYHLVTAFEVLEHLADVGSDLDQLFAGGHDYILVGTVLHTGHQPGWWYYMLESGQHIAFYSRATLRWIADHHGYDLEVGDAYALFVRRGIRIGSLRRLLLRTLLQHPTATAELVASLPTPLLRRFGRYRSRREADHAALRARSR